MSSTLHGCFLPRLILDIFSTLRQQPMSYCFKREPSIISLFSPYRRQALIPTMDCCNLYRASAPLRGHGVDSNRDRSSALSSTPITITHHVRVTTFHFNHLNDASITAVYSVVIRAILDQVVLRTSLASYFLPRRPCTPLPRRGLSKPDPNAAEYVSFRHMRTRKYSTADVPDGDSCHHMIRQMPTTLLRLHLFVSLVYKDI